jgi:hypothetical protein
MSEEEKRNLEFLLLCLNSTPEKKNRWTQNRIEYGTLFTMGLIIGWMEGRRMK